MVDGSGQHHNPFAPLSKLLDVFKDKEIVLRPDNSLPERVFQIPAKQKRLSDEIKTQVVERYKAGETALSIAAAFDIHRCTVFVIIKKAGVSRRK
jgi:hypothetical protein